MRFSAEAGAAPAISRAAASAASPTTRLKILARMKTPKAKILQGNDANLPARRAGEKRCDILCRAIAWERYRPSCPGLSRASTPGHARRNDEGWIGVYFHTRASVSARHPSAVLMSPTGA